MNSLIKPPAIATNTEINKTIRGKPITNSKIEKAPSYDQVQLFSVNGYQGIKYTQRFIITDIRKMRLDCLSYIIPPFNIQVKIKERLRIMKP